MSLEAEDATLLGLPEAPTSQRDATSGSKAWSAATICKFLEALELKQAIIDTKFCIHLMRNPPPPRQKKWIHLDARLQNVMDHSDDYEVLHYLTVIGCLNES